MVTIILRLGGAEGSVSLASRSRAVVTVQAGLFGSVPLRPGDSNRTCMFLSSQHWPAQEYVHHHRHRCFRSRGRSGEVQPDVPGKPAPKCAWFPVITMICIFVVITAIVDILVIHYYYHFCYHKL